MCILVKSTARPEQWAMMRQHSLSDVPARTLVLPITQCLSRCQTVVAFQCLSVSHNPSTLECRLHTKAKKNAAVISNNDMEYWERIPGGESFFTF